MRPAVALIWLISGQLALGQNQAILDRVEDAYATVQTFDFHGTTQEDAHRQWHPASRRLSHRNGQANRSLDFTKKLFE
jgi:hypothetical protein